ncbi:cation:proton antiporter [Rhodococcus triatomae]|uniref:Kef-type K+ transport system, membrane component KefB n=1 Tax=Rhodococcus triatomae TaxID=300028 RepID=A0A1G8MT57_9NOCA|nr:cation:proton antiporter [Rhodococcus triatomae]QNG19081.1 cation:proton antiporter [Rhodococcus triatomae]QNG25006.1 cation:proton antiporter [Rhodococcus triatomae]SDI71027.1 Kef-type K+ transport system, membrane component KefB [Rhodococcus triatomae]
MQSIEVSLFWIVLCALIAPILAGLVPRRLVPEVVLMLVAGVIIGPYGLHLADVGSEIALLQELGLGMLFLLAGYEVDTDELNGPGGRRALATWLVCLALAFGLVGALGAAGLVDAEVAIAIALVSTALGTLLPILRDAGLIGTTLGRAVLNHGAVGELAPVIAMAVLLGARGTFGSMVALALFLVAAALIGRLPRHLAAITWFADIVRRGAQTTSQTTVRGTMLLLVTLLVMASAFDLDVILGAFAAGFILRRLVPTGDDVLESKLDGLAFGFLIPIFFITAGMGVDVGAVAEAPWVPLVFFVMIVLVRGGPVLWATRLDRTSPERAGGRTFTGSEQCQVALYSATGLPLIVAVTGVAVDAGQMSHANASMLIAAGALTVLALPLSAALLRSRTDTSSGRAR